MAGASERGMAGTSGRGAALGTGHGACQKKRQKIGTSPSNSFRGREKKIGLGRARRGLKRYSTQTLYISSKIFIVS